MDGPDHVNISTKIIDVPSEGVLSDFEDRRNWVIDKISPLMLQVSELIASQHMQMVTGVLINEDEEGINIGAFGAGPEDMHPRMEMVRALVNTPDFEDGLKNFIQACKKDGSFPMLVSAIVDDIESSNKECS